MAKRITEIDGKALRYSRDFSFEKVKYYRDIGYKPPFRLLLDESVVEVLFVSDFERLASVASKILKEDVLIYISKCTVGEATLSQARENPYCSIAKCDHPQDRIDPAECIQKIIGVDNSHKFFLVTNKEGVAKNYANLQIAYGVPVMFHGPKGLRLNPPGNTKNQQELNEQEQRAGNKRKRNELRKMRRMEASKKEGDGYFDQAAVHSRKKAANRARKRQRELEEQQQQEEAEA